LRTPVQLADQVEEFLKTRPPTVRQKLKRALHELECGKGDISPLYKEFEGYCRLRVADVRVIFEYKSSRTGPVCECVFAESRDIVYEKFAAILAGE
jgi:mRNA-degrading endonuclease RelE of RelBE toxin-antitoxin system